MKITNPRNNLFTLFGTLVNESFRSPQKIERVDGKPFTLKRVRLARAFSFSKGVTTMVASNGASIVLRFTRFGLPPVVFPSSFTCVSSVLWINNTAFFQIDDLVVDSNCVIDVDIDIKPGSDPNSVNCNNQNVSIAVAILTTDDFDATTVDHTTVTFEGASETHMDKKSGLPRRHEEDVDGDGDTDLVFHFRLGETGLGCGSTQGTLQGQTFGGQAIEGTDVVRMIDEGGGPA